MSKSKCLVFVVVFVLMFAWFTPIANAETLGPVDIVDTVSMLSGATVKSDAVIDIVFNVSNNDTVQQTVSFTPQWSKILRYVTVPAGSTADITVSYPITKTVDYGGSALNLEVLAEVGEESKMYGYHFTVEREPDVSIRTYLSEGAVPVIGEALNISTEVMNTGNVPLHNLVITHTVLGDVQLKAAELLPGANKLFNSRVLVSADMILDGSFTNVSTLVSDEVTAEPFVYSSDFEGELPEPTTGAESPIVEIEEPVTEPTKAIDGSTAEMPKTGINDLLYTTTLPIALVIFGLVGGVVFLRIGRKKDEE